MDYAVIVQVRHQFGNEDLDIGVFVGQEQEFSFNCPGIDAGQPAVLLFQGQRVGEEQTLEINGATVFGGIPSGPVVGGATSVEGTGAARHRHSFISSSFGWSAYTMLVGPHVLKASDNVMRVASRESAEFVIDNVVLLYKTRTGGILDNRPAASL